MKNQPHQIELTELQEWFSSQTFTFASSSRESKKLTCSLNGAFTITVGGIVLWRGMQPASAVDIYNSITDEFKPF